MVRYADDLVVLCRWKPPEVYMPKLRQFPARLRVTVNEDKTRIVDAKNGFDFLGVHFWDKVKAAIARQNRPSLQEKLDRLKPILRGWSAYFGWLNSAQHFRKVDQYVTWKLRRSLPAKHQRRRFWKTPLPFWRKAGLYSTQGRIVHTSCAYELNAAGGRLPESRMREKLHVRFDEGVLETEPPCKRDHLCR